MPPRHQPALPSRHVIPGPATGDAEVVNVANRAPCPLDGETVGVAHNCVAMAWLIISSGVRERRSGWGEAAGIAGDAFGDAEVVDVAIKRILIVLV